MASAPNPISVRKTERTVAKIGRSMKLWVTGKFLSSRSWFWPWPSTLAVSGGVVMDDAVLRRDLGAGNGAHEAVDDDAVARLEPRLDHAQSAAKVACGHDLRFHGCISADGHHQPLRL